MDKMNASVAQNTHAFTELHSSNWLLRWSINCRVVRCCCRVEFKAGNPIKALLQREGADLILDNPKGCLNEMGILVKGIYSQNQM